MKIKLLSGSERKKMEIDLARKSYHMIPVFDNQFWLEKGVKLAKRGNLRGVYGS